MSDQDPHGCLDALLKLQPYLDGELSAEEAEKVRLHFELCAPCTPAMRYLKSFQNSLRRASADLPVAPPELKQRISDILRAQE